jgi:hypothetical protein
MTRNRCYDVRRKPQETFGAEQIYDVSQPCSASASRGRSIVGSLGKDFNGHYKNDHTDTTPRTAIRNKAGQGLQPMSTKAENARVCAPVRGKRAMLTLDGVVSDGFV